MAKFLDDTGLGTFWSKIKSTFQTLGNLVTTSTGWSSTPSDTKYPSEKLVKDSLDAKLSYFDATYMRNNVAGDGWVKLADVGSIVRSSGDINGVWEVILIGAAVGIWRESITLDVRFGASEAPQILLFNRVYENVKKTGFEFCVKVIGLAGSGNSNVELWAKLQKGWYSVGIREVGASNIASKIKWNYYSYSSNGGSSKPVADAGNNIQVADPTYIGGDDFVKVTGGTMTGPLNAYLMSTRATMVGNEYNCLLNAKERGILTFTQSGSGQLTEDQVWGLFDGKIIPQYGTAIDPEDPYILTLDLSSFINAHCQVFSAFGWTCRYWEPLKFKVELYDTYSNVNEWVTICDYSQTQYTGQYSGGGTASLFVKFGSGTVNPHTGVTRGGMFKKIRITIWKGNESTNRWGISEIFFCYPENYSVYGGLHAYAADKATNAKYADQLSTARYLAVALGNTSTDTAFDGHVSVTNIKTTGTLGVGNGGTGKTSVTAGNYLVGNGANALTEKTPNTAANDLINALSTGDATPTGEDYYVAQYAGGGTTTKTYHRRPIKALWEYIKAQISSVLGLTATSYGGNAATATTAQNYNTSTGTIKTALDGKVDFGLSNNTSNIGNDAPAADCISYWGSDNIPSNHIKMVYNQPGLEATLIFSKRSTYGSIVKYGYADKYVYILRNQNGTWKSNDWEKISAGYADSAGTATTAQNYDTNTGTIKDALALKSDTSHTHVADANDVTNNAAGSDLSEVTDTTEFVTTNIGGYSSSDKKLYRRPFGTKIWPWIKSKLGISSAVGSSTLPVYFDSNGQAKAIGSDLQVVKGSSDSEATVRAAYDGNNKIYLCSNSTTNGLAMYNGGNFKWMCSSDRNGNATFNGNATSATSATSATTASSADYLKYQNGNEINFKNVPSASSSGPRTWFNYRNGDSGSADSSNKISDYVFGNRNNDVQGVRLHAEGIAFRSFYPQANEAFFAKVTLNSNGCGTIRFRVTGYAKASSTGNDIFGSCDIVVKCRGNENNWHAFYTRSIRSTSDSTTAFLQGIYYESGTTFYIGVRKSGFASRIHVEVIDCCTSNESMAYESTSPYRGFTYEIGNFNSSVTGTAANMQGGTAAYNPANVGTATGSSSTPVFVDAVGKITACTSVNADTVDGVHIAVGSYTGRTDTIYFY